MGWQKVRRWVAREPAHTSMCAGQAKVVTGTAAPQYHTGRLRTGISREFWELPGNACRCQRFVGREMMPSRARASECQNMNLAFNECTIGCNVYADANANGSATASGWHSVNTGAGAPYHVPRPSAAVPARGRRQNRYEMALPAYSRTRAVAKTVLRQFSCRLFRV